MAETQSVGEPDVLTVGKAFVAEYYQYLQQSPESLYKFYNDDSVLKWPGVKPATTQKEIHETIMSSVYPGCKVKIVHADAQESLMDGVIMNISGCLFGNDKVKRIFTQTFFLAKQERGFYVLNDNFRVLDTNELLNHSFAGETEEEVASLVVESVAVAPTGVPAAQPEPEEEAVSVPAASVEKTPAVTVAAAEAPKEAVSAAQNAASSEKPEAKKFSYASMVVKEAPTTENSGPKVVRVAPTSNHQSDVHSVPSTGNKPSMGNKTKESTSVSHGAKGKNAANNDFRSEASLSRTVYIRDLPTKITKPELANALKQFGLVKLESIQIRDFDDGFCFGFVEFESEAMAKAAVQAHTVIINGLEAHISFKKSKAANNGQKTGGGRGGEFHSNGGGRGGGEFRGQGRGGSERPKKEFGGFRNNRDGRAQGAGEGRW